MNANGVPAQALERVGQYTRLIERLFSSPTVVAVIGTSYGNAVTGICEGIASELSRLGKTVALVSVSTLLQASPLNLTNETTRVPEIGRNVWLWPSPLEHSIDLFANHDDFESVPKRIRTPVAAKHWLKALRKNFDSVLLDCSSLLVAPRAAAIAAMAEAAILAVDVAHTSKHQIVVDQRALQLSGVKLEGCILINSV